MLTPSSSLDMPYDIDERHRINMRREFRYAQNFHAYKLLVEDLSTRNLTYEGDALKSMTGVLQAMSMSRPERYICGLPSSMLEWALLWQPKGPLIRRGTTVFPSWSWVSKSTTLHVPWNGFADSGNSGRLDGKGPSSTSIIRDPKE